MTVAELLALQPGQRVAWLFHEGEGTLVVGQVVEREGEQLLIQWDGRPGMECLVEPGDDDLAEFAAALELVTDVLADEPTVVHKGP